MDQAGLCSLEILNLESGVREKLFQFKEEFSIKVEKHLAHNENWIVIPFEKETLVLDIQNSQIKYLEKAIGKFKKNWVILVSKLQFSNILEQKSYK